MRNACDTPTRLPASLSASRTRQAGAGQAGPRLGRSQTGQALVEYAIIFPVQLMLTLAIIQLAHIFIAKQVLGYAAYCATRAALVDEDPKRAACVPLSRIAGDYGAPEDDSFLIPVSAGSGISSVPLPRFGAAMEKTKVEPRRLGNPDEITYRVTHWYQLSVPVGGNICGYIAELFLGYRPPPDQDLRAEFGSLEYIDYDTYGSAHLVLKSECTLIKPWSDN